jgi:hypothetical protein
LDNRLPFIYGDVGEVDEEGLGYGFALYGIDVSQCRQKLIDGEMKAIIHMELIGIDKLNEIRYDENFDFLTQDEADAIMGEGGDG